MLKEDEQDKADTLMNEIQAKPISDYWLKVFKNSDVLDQAI